MTTIFDTRIVGKGKSATDFISNILQASTEYSIIGKDMDGTIQRLRKNGERFTARVVITSRRDAAGKPVGYLLISKDISDEIRLISSPKNSLPISVTSTRCSSNCILLSSAA